MQVIKSVAYNRPGNYPPCDRSMGKNEKKLGTSHPLSSSLFNSPVHCQVIKKREAPNATRAKIKCSAKKGGFVYFFVSLQVLISGLPVVLLSAVLCM